MDRHQSAIRTSWFSIAGNFILAVIKALAGVLGHSFALIADAIESTTDIFSSVLVLLGLKYAARPPDENHPYGHGRIEPLVTFVVVAFMVTSATIIAIQSVRNIMQPHQSPEKWTLIVLGVIILWKEFSFRFVSKRSDQTHSTSLKADAWHHRSDALTSIAAFIGILVAVILGDGYEAADDWAALVAVAFILFNSYLIFRPALGEIMDEHVYDGLTDEIREVAQKVDGIIGTEKCLIRKAGMIYHVDLHAIVDANISVKEGHDLAHDLQDALRREIPGLGGILIHVEPNLYDVRASG